MLLTAKELAEELKVSLAAIRKWTRQGLPAVRLGYCTRFELGPARQWLEHKAGEQRRSRVATRQGKTAVAEVAAHGQHAK